MSNFIEFEHALVCAARFVLDDAREFIFSCTEDAPRQFSFKALPHGPQMNADDADHISRVFLLDELGRVSGRMTRAQQDTPQG